MRIIAFLLCLLFCLPAFAQTQIQNLPPVGSLTGPENFPLAQGGITKQATTSQLSIAIPDIATGATTGSRGLVGRLTTNSYTLVTTLSSLCGSVLTGDQCTAIFGFADPRNYGAFCDSNFNQNNNFHDDSAGINAAYNNSSAAPVFIPNPGCKIASGTKMTNYGQTIFAWPRGNAYDANVKPTNPYIFLPNNLATAISANAITNVNNTGTRCAIDVHGFDGSGIYNMVIKGNFRTPGGTFGTTALCNGYDQFFDPRSSKFNVGQGDGTQCGTGAGCASTGNVFTVIEHVSIGNVGMAMGGVTDGTTCQPYYQSGGTSGFPGASIWQVQAHDIHIANSCLGIWHNFSDAKFDLMFLDTTVGPAFSTVPAFSGMSPVLLSNIRCEQTFTKLSGAIPNSSPPDDMDGACMNIESSFQITNLECDNTYGACLRTGTSTGFAHIVNAQSNRSGAGSTVTNKCAFVFNGSSHIDAQNIVATSSPQPSHVLCTLGTVDDVNWNGSFSGGSSGSYLSLANPVTHFKFDVPEMTHFLSGDAVTIGTQSAVPSNAAFNVYGHLTTQQAAVPVASSCGGGAAAAGSTDHSGTITGITTGTTCTLTFGSAWAQAPSCHPDFSVTGITDKYVSAVSTLAVTFTFTSMTGSLYYRCD